MVNETLIDKYLRNEMDDQERVLFLKELSLDSSLRREFNLTKDIAYAINEKDVIQLRKQLDRIHQEITRKVPVFDITRILKVAAVITGFIFISSLLWINRRVENTDVYEKFFEPYQSTIRVRSAENNESILSKAMNYYDDGKYFEAAQLFEIILTADSNRIAVNLYSGITNLEIKEYHKANKSFNRIITNKDSPFVEPAEWYLGFCYLMTNDRDKAIVIFEKISKSESYYQKKAGKILKMMKRMNE